MAKSRDIFEALSSLGVANPKKQLTLYFQNIGIGSSGAGERGATGATGATGAAGNNAPVGLSMGPWTEARILGFINRSGVSIVLSSEQKIGTGTITWRKKNGSNTSLPITLDNGDLFEVEIENISGRVYLGYRVEEA